MTGASWASVAISGVAAVVAIVACVFTGLSVRAMRAQAESSKDQAASSRAQAASAAAQAESAIEQTEIQRQLRKDAMQPYIWADIRPDERRGGFLTCVVGNSGPTVATDVQVWIDPPMTLYGAKPELRRTWQPPLISSLAPGRRYQWNLGIASAEITGKDAQPRTFVINGQGPFGSLPELKYTVDFALYRYNFVVASVSETHRVANMIEDEGKALTDAVLKVARSMNRPTVYPPESTPPTGNRRDRTAATILRRARSRA